MIVFPNCKINLGLLVTGKRPDGFHDLETIFYPLPMHDVLEAIHEDDKETLQTGVAAPLISDTRLSGLRFTTSGNPIPGAAGENICIRAWEMIKKDYPSLPPVWMHLHKMIPHGAGLGGGSANGAFTLDLLNRKFNLGISREQLITYALALGSDCPYFLYNKPALATGRGEQLTPLTIDLSAYQVVIVNPGITISTAEAFRNITPRQPQHTLADIHKHSPYEWKNILSNAFEQPVFVQYPLLQDIKEKLYRNGAFFASMTGTGSTVFGLFHKEQKPAFDFPAEWFVKILPC